MNEKTITRPSRIMRGEDFAAVKAGGVRARSGPLVVSVLFKPVRRLGIVMTRHVGGAVQRNRMRRVIRETFRVEGHRFPQGDCVVLPREGAACLNNEELRKHLRTCLDAIMTRGSAC